MKNEEKNAMRIAINREHVIPSGARNLNYHRWYRLGFTFRQPVRLRRKADAPLAQSS
jgi:hypothetical protein